MRGNVGDLIIQHGRRVNQRDRIGTIVEVRGEQGPILVRFGDREPRLVFPGPDTEVAHPQSGTR